MGQLIPMAVFDEQVSTDEIRETRALLEALVPDDGTTGFELGASEEIADLLQRCAVLQGDAHQASDNVVEPDQFGGTISAFQSRKDFRRSCVIVDADVERAEASNLDLLRDMFAAIGEGKPVAHAASTSRSMTKLSGRSVVCWFPLGTPAFIPSPRPLIPCPLVSVEFKWAAR
jgi:hypothetical protein